MEISNIAISADASPVNIKMASPRFTSPRGKSISTSRKPVSPSPRALSSPAKSSLKSSNSSPTSRSSRSISPRATSPRASAATSSPPAPLKIAEPPPPDHSQQLAAARRDFEASLAQQRHDILAKLISALHTGAEYHYTEQRTQLYTQLYQHFHPNIIYDLRRLITICGLHVFEINRTAMYDSDIIKLKQRHLITDDHIHMVLTVLNNYKKRCLGVLFYYDKKFQKYNQVHTLLAEREAYWKEKTVHDVRRLNDMKLSELRITKSLANALHMSSDDVGEDLAPLPILTPLRDSSKITSQCAVADDFIAKSNRVKTHILEKINQHCSNVEADVNSISIIGTNASDGTNATTSSTPRKSEKAVLVSKAHNHIAQMRHMAMQVDIFLENQRSTSKQLKLQLRSVLEHAPDPDIQCRLHVSSPAKK